MSTYSAPIDISSYFVDGSCLRDDVAEYASEDEYVTCSVARARVSSIVLMIVTAIVMAVLIAVFASTKSTSLAIAFGVVGVVGPLLAIANYLLARRSARIQWGQNAGELDLLKKKYKVMNPANTDEQNEILARDEQRNIQQYNRSIRAQERMASSRSSGLMNVGMGFMRR